MTYYLIRHEESAIYTLRANYKLQKKTVETLEEAKEWAAENYDEVHPPYAIRGEKIEFDFTRTVTVIAKVKD